jgi:3-isopropylmalate/(R)-2-methylmalate dehydratase small subunit
VSGRGILFPGDDVDTDRIIPARFMKCVTFDGLGEHLFRDVRLTPDGRKTDHVFNDPRFDGGNVLFVGNNFGCGSSREHAPQAIYRYGIRAIVGAGFAEIFFGNCTTLGIPCVTASAADLDAMTSELLRDPSQPVRVDVEKLQVTVGARAWPVTLRAAARQSLLEGKWDAIAELLDGLPQVRELAAQLARA